MVKTRGNIDARAEKPSSDQMGNGRDTEVPRRKKAKKHAKHKNEQEINETDSTHNREQKKLRKSKRQKQKRQQEQARCPRRSHRNSNKNSASDSEDEREATEDGATNEGFNSQSEEENRSKSRNNSSNKNSSLEVQAEENMEETESVNKSEEQDGSHVTDKKSKTTSKVKKNKKLKKKLKLLKKKKLLRSKDASQSGRKLRSSMRHLEVNSDGNSSKKEPTSENDQVDMYTIVKRDRKRADRSAYGMPVLDREVSRESRKREEDDFIKEDDDDDRESGEGDNEEEEEEEEEMTYLSSGSTSITSELEGSSILEKSYNLRKHKMPTNSYAESSKKKYSRRMERNRETDTSISDDDVESNYDKPKDRNKLKRFLPINMRDGHSTSAGNSKPLIDENVKFSSIGGLDKHIMSLKEMVVFPFLYPEFFQRFKIRAPKGVLFYGPPGTGKTLVARALANECSQGHKKVAFFLRKGSDCLSKWVGESEKHLRILFEQAHQMKPSIIFFDEIDGLIPVRSGKQDQVHNSIVSTLLALMDGLDDQGQVVMIGSTNRIDSIDPAFRRPGRFDRELLFPLPAKEGREEILNICTREWLPRLPSNVVEYLAANTDGYSGADLKGLCTETALIALKRRYPQIFFSKDKLAINVQDIRIELDDFALAMQQIVPSANRSFAPVAKALPLLVRPLVETKLKSAFGKLNDIFPSQPLQAIFNLTVKGSNDIPCEVIEEGGVNASSNLNNGQPFTLGGFPSLPPIYRPRFLISGKASQGQTSYLCPAVLHLYEGLPVHVIDLATTFSGDVNSSVDTLCQILRQFKNCIPSILYLPDVNLWWSKVDEVTGSVLMTSLDRIDPSMPLLILASSSVPYEDAPQEIKSAFQNFYEMEGVDVEERRNFFRELVTSRPCVKPVRRKKRIPEDIPVAWTPTPNPPSVESMTKVIRNEDGILRNWRMYLRDILRELFTCKESSEFRLPVKESEVPDYYELIRAPMDLTTMKTKIDLNRYKNSQEFLDDIDLIHKNALEYNSIKNRKGLKIRSHARLFKDFAYLLVDDQPDTELERQCMNIHKERLARGEEVERFEREEFEATMRRRTREVKKSEASSVVDRTRTGTSKSFASTRSSRPKSKASRCLEEEFDWTDRLEKKKLSAKRSQTIYSSDEDKTEPPTKRIKPSSSSKIESTSTGPTRSVLATDSFSSDIRPRPSLFASSLSFETPKRSRTEDEEEEDGRMVFEEEKKKEEEEKKREEEEKKREEKRGDKEEAEEEPEPPLVVSHELLEHLLDLLVACTEGFMVEELVKVHSSISKAIYKHKDAFNKMKLVDELMVFVSSL